MSPLRGGEAAKFGDRYEGRWTVRQLLYILQGQADAVTVEAVGEIGEGAEFTLQRGGLTEVHQVKRQIGTANDWKPSDLNSCGVLDAARRHVAAGRRFHFVSIVPARVLDELAGQALRSSDLQSFIDHRLTNPDLRSGFDYLSGKAYDSAETAWTTLRDLEVRWPDEREVVDGNAALAGLLLKGAEGRLAAVGLGDLVWDHLGIRLDAAKIEELLPRYGLRRNPLSGSPAISQAVRALSASWSASVARELLQPTISRSESSLLVEQIREAAGRLLFVIGTAGAGKSAVLHETVGQIEADHWPVLALRLDRIEPFSSTRELGQRCGLEVSPVTALAAVAQGRPSLLVIDQLDAVSLASGRMPTTFEAVADLLREATVFPEMRVVLACRKFDVDNDHRIRSLVGAEGVTRIEMSPLTDEQVDAAVQSMRLPADALTTAQRDLLRTPLHLVLLQTIADQPDALSFTTSRQLFDAFWERKRRDCQQRRAGRTRFAEVVGVLAEAMSERQRLSVPRSVLDRGDLLGDADVLGSEHVLVRDGGQLAFFHEAFFDYAFARQWINRHQTLVEFLRAGQQELFRRAQVRQILAHLRGEDPERYISEVEAVLADPSVRFHIKETVLAFLGSLTDPTTAEWEMMARLFTPDLPFVSRLWMTMRTPAWFDRLDAEGIIERWLAADDVASQGHALEVMLGGVKERPDRLAELLAPHAGNNAQYQNWLGVVTRFGDLHQSRALFELVLAAIRRGEYQGREDALWMPTFSLGQHRPTWAVELLAAYLAERSDAFEVDHLKRVTALQSTEQSALELTSYGAAGAPETFCVLLLPYMFRVMQLTEYDPQTLPIADRHFSYRHPVNGPAHELDDALLRGAVTALRKLVETDDAAAQPILETLAADRHDGAQWLLYEGLRVAGERYAAWAAGLLLEGDHRFECGYAGNPAWTARQLLQAITPYISGESFTALEQAVMDLRRAWERRQSAGWASFTLLSAMAEDRLSEAAKRRLGELRRRFNMQQPPEPRDPPGGVIQSPIPPDAASRMSDEQWLGAFARHSTDRSDFATLKGGAHELSGVLKTEVAADPMRFARLALRLTDETNPSYGNAILMALAETTEPIEPAAVFDVIRHIASLHNDEYQNWLGYPLRRDPDSEVPDDIIEIILRQALRATSPTSDGWREDRGPGLRGDIWSFGLNSARGHAIVVLGDLLAHDADGHRTALIAPALGQMSEDPIVAVRCCVGYLLTRCLRHARVEATAAFRRLILTDDRLLATRQLLDLMTYIGLGEPDEIDPVIKRMLNSAHADVRQGGGMLAAFAGLELGLGHLMTTARGSQDAATRTGAAELCARRLPHTTDSGMAADALGQFVNDQDDNVRKAAGKVAVALRSQALRPFEGLLMTLIASESFSHALTQLLITLQHAPDRIDNLVIQCTRRFLDVHATDISTIATAAAREARDIGQLILRAYAQAANGVSRAGVLDLIDQLLLAGAFDFAQNVNEAER